MRFFLYFQVFCLVFSNQVFNVKEYIYFFIINSGMNKGKQRVATLALYNVNKGLCLLLKFFTKLALAGSKLHKI